MRLKKVIFESDSKPLINIVRGVSSTPSGLQALLKEVHYLLHLIEVLLCVTSYVKLIVVLILY